jgi:hypothetical protein
MNDLIGLEEKTSSDVMDLYPTTVAYLDAVYSCHC